jgi:hypothetical protein
MRGFDARAVVLSSTGRSSQEALHLYARFASLRHKNHPTMGNICQETDVDRRKAGWEQRRGCDPLRSASGLHAQR